MTTYPAVAAASSSVSPHVLSTIVSCPNRLWYAIRYQTKEAVGGGVTNRLQNIMFLSSVSGQHLTTYSMYTSLRYQIGGYGVNKLVEEIPVLLSAAFV